MAKINVRDRNKNKPDKKPNWEYRFEIARVNGKRNHLQKAGFATKKEAMMAGTQALAQYNNTGKNFEPSEISTADCLEYWLKNYAEVNLADATVEAYSNIIKNHLIPRIGFYKVKSIDTLTLQEMINAIFVERGFSKAFLKSILKILKSAFKYARATAKFIQFDPAQDVTLPRFEPKEKPTAVLKKQEIATLLERFVQSPYQYYAILVSYYTGLRVSEAYGLTWDCIDFEKRTLTVKFNAKKLKMRDNKGKKTGGIRGKAHTKWYLGACKTISSYRTISIDEMLVEALKKYKADQEKNEAEYGDLYIKHYLKEEKTTSNRTVYRIVSLDGSTGMKVPLPRAYLVMIKENGEFHGTDCMKYPSKVAKYELGIDFRFHKLRHTHASQLYADKVPMKVIQERLGHSNFLTTMNTYVELFKEKGEKDVNDLEETSINIIPRNERLYSLWKSMINRCKSTAYYTARNIQVCEEWKNFEVFNDWALMNGYLDNLFLERLDKDGDFNEANCVWSTKSEVKSNKKTNTFVTKEIITLPSSESYTEQVVTREIPHGRLYTIWRDTMRRCEDKSYKHYPYAGAHGIKLCEDWHIFSNFNQWALTHGYTDNLFLGRINRNLDYIPENCYWAEKKTDDPSSILLTVNQTTKTLGEWSKVSNLSIGILYNRFKSCWSPQKIVNTPKRNSTKVQKNKTSESVVEGS